MRKGVLAVLAAVAISGCAAWSDEVTNPLQPGRILFDCYRLDTEWGFDLEGIYIDSDGVVWYYSHDEPWYPAEQRTTVVTEGDLLMKYAEAKKVGSVAPSMMEEMAGLIKGAAKGRVSRETPLFERSGSLDVAYVFNFRTENYEMVFLQGSGSWAARNFSSEARQLVDFLNDVKKTVGFDKDGTD